MAIGDDISAPEKLVLQALQAGIENGRAAGERQWLAVALTQGVSIPQRVEIIAEVLADLVAEDQAAAVTAMCGALKNI